MAFRIVRGDIVQMHMDAIVTTANAHPIVEAGENAEIYDVAGPKLLAYRQQVGNITIGGALISPGYDLNARYVIHAIGPKWQGGNWNEEETLRCCYKNVLLLARRRWCRSVAFPLICTGTYGFPKDKALQVAISVFTEFLSRHDMEIILVVPVQDSARLSERLFDGIASYIDRYSIPCMTDPKANLEDMLKQADAGFSETLLKLIRKIGKKDSEVYKKANISRQHFSKLRKNPDYKPTKPTAVALALALELDLTETNDLIGRAGFTLGNSSKFDLIIRYFIETCNYNIIEINIALYEFDQLLLGS